MAKKCKPTQMRNPKTGRCVLKSGSIGKALRKKSSGKKVGGSRKVNVKKVDELAKYIRDISTKEDSITFTTENHSIAIKNVVAGFGYALPEFEIRALQAAVDDGTYTRASFDYGDDEGKQRLLLYNPSTRGFAYIGPDRYHWASGST